MTTLTEHASAGRKPAWVEKTNCELRSTYESPPADEDDGVEDRTARAACVSSSDVTTKMLDVYPESSEQHASGL